MDVMRRTMMGGALSLAVFATQPRAAAQPVTDLRYADVGGARLAYQTHPGPRGAPAIVFVHGYNLRSTGAIYSELIELLTATHTVHAVDMRGHGGSATVTADWSLERLADDAAAFSRALRLDRPAYVGHSFAGAVGMLAALRHPDAFSALALVTTVPATGAGGLDVNVARELLATMGRDPATLRGFFTPMFRLGRAADVERAMEAAALVEPSVHRAFFTQLGTFSVQDRLGAIRTPVLLVNGGLDKVTLPEQQHMTALGLARSKEVVFSGENHMLPIEAAAAVAREVQTFLLHDAPVLAGVER
jgi:pimeloyl-ACP methyl ester carboxylesterase